MSGSAIATSPEHTSLDGKKMKRQDSHPHLMKFKEAKQEIIGIFNSMALYIGECLRFIESQDTSEERFSALLSPNMLQDIRDYHAKVSGIQDVISRNQMKCAFFGRTSNGKSTVINAMLGSRILPSGIGHTTSCFLQVEGTNEENGYILSKTSDDAQVNAQHRSIDSVALMAHSLSNVRLSTDALIRVYWPSTKCNLLKEGVVLLDSPGIDVDPDMDAWIDKYCLDADVFILVANAESTLMQAEKNFFHKVSQRLSKPNIFILNNRWDASANEMDLAAQVRSQHLERCVAFLADELQVCGKGEAEDRVYFISAKETLANRSRATPASTPVLEHQTSLTNFSLVDGWEDRLSDFANFEKHFERILSDAAIKTKFAAHASQGQEMTGRFHDMMDKLYGRTVEEKNIAMSCRTACQSRLETLRLGLDAARTELEQAMRSTLDSVQLHVSQALSDEIRRLGDLVDDFTKPFHPDRTLLLAYKAELNEHMEHELGRKLVEACARDLHREISRSEKLMLDRYAALLTEEPARSNLQRLVNLTTFEPDFRIDCRNLCSDFQEDLDFRFSLSPINLLHLLAESRHSRFGAVQVHSHLMTSEPPIQSSSAPGGPVDCTDDKQSDYSGRSLPQMGGPMGPLLVHALPSVASRFTVGAVVVCGIVVKLTGWRVLAGIGALYGAVYLYERLSWTNKSKERSFKRQYVDFASKKLRLMVDMTSASAKMQAKHQLTQIQRSLRQEVEQSADHLKQEVTQLDSDISQLDAIGNTAKGLRNSSGELVSRLSKFYHDYISCTWPET